MTNQEIARATFAAFDKEMIECMFRGVGDEKEIEARYGYRHGWISVNGEGFNKDKAFPEVPYGSSFDYL